MRNARVEELLPSTLDWPFPTTWPPWFHSTAEAWWNSVNRICRVCFWCKLPIMTCTQYLFNMTLLSNLIYPENSEETQLIVGSMNLEYEIYPTLLGHELATCSVLRYSVVSTLCNALLLLKHNFLTYVHWRGYMRAKLWFDETRHIVVEGFFKVWKQFWKLK